MEEKVITLKQKVFKTIYYLTFLPYTILMIFAICRAIFGISIWGNMYFGLDAFQTAIVFIVYGLHPVFIACLAFQVLFKILTRKHIEYKQYNRKIAITVVIVISILLNTLYNILYLG